MSEIKEEAVLKALSQIQDPDLHQDIVSLGFIKDLKISGGEVSFKIELTTPACPVKKFFKDKATELVMAIPGVEKVNVEMTARVRSSVNPSKKEILPGVKNVIPVASAKGGVGKSTVSANLALSLARTGAKVGLMDADIYGPSIPLLMGIKEQPELEIREDKMVPFEKYGIKLISVGFFLPEDQAVIWRGPMLYKMITQFVESVEWGELDYLVIDLPPGTGDVQLTLCQQVPLTGAVIVSTPQKMAVKVTKKAIYMFKQLNCPLLGVIENMSYYLNSDGEKDYIFGTEGAKAISQEFNIPQLGEIPIATNIRVQSDEGKPIVESQPDAPQSQVFASIAANLAAQVSKMTVSGEINQEIKVNF